MARQLAKVLNYLFIDSGAMYRAIALYFIQHQIDLMDDLAVENALKNIRLTFQKNLQTGNNEIWLNDQNVEQLIREMEVASKVSDVAAINAVREFAVAQQQLIGKDNGVVMDGRDIGYRNQTQSEGCDGYSSHQLINVGLILNVNDLKLLLDFVQNVHCY